MKKSFYILLILCNLFSFKLLAVDITIGAGTTSCTSYPFYNLFENNKSQLLYLQSEIGSAITITHLSFSVKTVGEAGYRSFTNFTIKIKHTSSTSFGTAYEDMTGATTVFSSNPYAMPSATGYFSIDITDFAYNGTNNLIVEIVWGNNGTYTFTPYDLNGTTNASNMATYGYSVSQTPPNYSGRSTVRPNIKFTYTAESNPTVTTTSISSVTSSTASSGGNVSSDGGASVTARGACWNTSTNPTTSNSKTTDGTGTGSFSSSLTSLSAETYYYVRAYATNSAGTAYGSNAEFWTLSTEPSGHSATFSASELGSSQINLTFSAASTYGADGYIILRKTGAAAPDGTNVNDRTAPGSLSLPGGTTLVTTITDNGATSYSNTSLSEYTQYYYCIIPFNWNNSNAETYNYYTNATIPTATATTINGPDNEGFIISGNIVNNGTINCSSDINYVTMNGTSKSISGTGIYTETKLFVDGTIAFDGTINSGKFAEAFINPTKTYTINSNKTFKNDAFNNYGTTTLNSNSTWINSGNWVNASTVTADATSEVEFNGTSAQTITSGSSSFGNITINNSSTGITLQDEMSIVTRITFTDGIINSSSSNILTFGNSATSRDNTGSYAAKNDSHVNGPVKKNTNSATKFTFPVGDGTYHRSIAITPASTGATTWTADFVPTGHIDQTVTGIVNHVSALEYWTLDRNSGSESAKIELSWNSNSVVDANYTELIVCHYNGVDWETIGGNNHTGNASAGTLESNAGWNTFSPFTLGSTSNNNPLPISLTSFSVICDDEKVNLNWTTSSEVNNDYFTIEKTVNGFNFDHVGTILGSGTSNNLNNYNFIDYSPNSGVSYYRLKQTDYNGKTEVFKLEPVNCYQENQFEMLAWGDHYIGNVNITLFSEPDQNLEIKITNYLGQLIAEKSEISKEISKISIPLNSHASGIYFVTAKQNDRIITKKIFW